MGKDDDENARVMAEPWCSFCLKYGHSADSHMAPSPLERRVAWLEAKLRLTYCEKHGHYTRTDENICPACRRGE